jgi:hypothetical protein
MFARRFFPASYFAPRFFPPVSGVGGIRGMFAFWLGGASAVAAAFGIGAAYQQIGLSGIQSYSAGSTRQPK